MCFLYNLSYGFVATVCCSAFEVYPFLKTPACDHGWWRGGCESCQTQNRSHPEPVRYPQTVLYTDKMSDEDFPGWDNTDKESRNLQWVWGFNCILAPKSLISR